MESLSLYHLDEGNTHLINQQYKASIQCYTNCIESTAVVVPSTNNDGNNDGNSDGNDKSQIEFIAFRAYSHRAESYLRLKEYAKAKDDILKSHSILLLPSSSSSSLSSSENDKHRDEIGMSFVRLGKACFELEEYKSSLESFDRAMEELSISSAADADADADANVSLEMKTAIQDYRKKSEKELEKLPVTIGDIPSTTETKPTSKPTLPTNTATTTSNTTTHKQPTCPKYQYYQNDNFMTIQILEPNLDATKVKVEFTLDKLTVIVQKGGKNFTVICGTLFSAVIVSKCKVKYMSEKVLIKLKKKHQHDWNNLFGGGAQEEDKEEEEQRLQAERAATTTTTTNPTAPAEGGNDTVADSVASTTTSSSSTKPKNTPYASNKDWNSIEKELKHEEENEKPEGEGAFQKFLKGMYKDADEDTRRAMIKSYQTSGGTHLSCNWDEVAKTDYEKQRTAPNGQEWKNWEGDKLPMKDDD